MSTLERVINVQPLKQLHNKLRSAAVINSVTCHSCYFCSAAPCSVDLRAWGYDDTVLDGYIRVNGQLKVNSTQPGPPNGPDLHTRGINTVLLNIATCTTSDLRNFDTYLRASDSDLLVNYLQSLPAGSVLLGVTFDEASIQLTPAAVQALTSIGANVTSLVFRGKFLFIAEIGCSSLTKFKIGQNGGDNLLLSADVPGSSSPFF
jgi:hypothetical protein